MAIFHHKNRTISYHIEHAPFDFDLMLLQGSRFNPDFWKPVREDLQNQPTEGGRTVTCEWSDSKLSAKEVAEDMIGLLRTLGLVSLHVVATDDAVDLVHEIQRREPGLIEKTLLFPNGGPKRDDLVTNVRDFCQI